MSKWHGGKGSKRRPEDTKKFNDNWDRIFNKENKDLNYESDNPLERPYEPSAVDDAADVMSKYAHPAYTRYPHLKELDEKRSKDGKSDAIYRADKKV